MHLPTAARSKQKTASLLRRAAKIAVVITLGVVAYGLFVGWSLTHPKRDPVTTTPANWGMPYQTVRFPSQVDHLRLHGWWLPSSVPTGMTVVMAHGYATNREQASIPGLAVARALHLMGINVLMFDFRDEGRSPGQEVSVGEFEQRDLIGAVNEVHRVLAPQDKVVLLGYSMGASTSILVGARDKMVAGVIADSPFADLTTYLRANLPKWTHLPAFPFNSIIFGLLPLITGLQPQTVNPLAVIDAMGRRPLLLIAGTGDVTIPDRNSIALYNRLKPVDPHAALWLVPNATHIHAFDISPKAYLQHLYTFLHQIDPRVKTPPASYGF